MMLTSGSLIFAMISPPRVQGFTQKCIRVFYHRVASVFTYFRPLAAGPNLGSLQAKERYGA
jgi:hypothetical protein